MDDESEKMTYVEPNENMPITAAFLRHRIFTLRTIQKATARVATSKTIFKIECAQEIAARLPQ
jgi:hypothetical protein